jgi:hypothetical protein
VNGIKPEQVQSRFSHIALSGRGTAPQFSSIGVVVDGKTEKSGAAMNKDVKDSAARFVAMQ